MSSTLRIAFAVLVAVTAAMAGMWLARERAPEPLELQHATLFPSGRPLPAFALVDQHGDSFGPERLRGHWTFLFFGFTQCPDVCPTTLATLAAARRELADLPAGEQPAVVLVSVDPGRDTAARLAKYVRFFDPAFTGVTGETDAIAAFTRELGVAVIFGEPDAAGQYTIDHTATLFLVGPDGTLAAIFGTPHSPDGIAGDYRRILAHRAGGHR